jgi:parallel beta-helix repeat protein
MIKRMVVAAFLVFICAASLVSFGSVRAQSVTTIFINADGSVSGTNAIQRVGNHYDLTESLYNTSIVVLCNNIVLDGGGFTLQGPNGWPTPAAINLTCTGVTVQNFVIKCWEVGILGAYDGNTISNNSIINNERGIAIYADNYQVEGNYIAQADYCIRVTGNNNTFTRNNIDNWGFAFWITDSSDILITENNVTSHDQMVFQTDCGNFQVYHNNFYNMGDRLQNTNVLCIYANATDTTFLPWDNGYPSGGNYWSDYIDRYPNATEIDDSGIGDIPYNVTADSFMSNLTVLDRYPLMSPVNIPNLPSAPNSQSQPTPSPTPSPAPTNSPIATAAASSNPQKFPHQNEVVLTIAAVIGTIAAIAIVAFVILRRNRATSQIN